jgi:RNA polymerase sigma factor (sigma-70 family)
LLRALEAVGGFEWTGEDSFLRWLFGISRNIQLDGARRARAAFGLEAAAEAASREPSPSQAARSEERFERLAEAIRALPAAYREVIRLSRIEGLKTRDIAGRLGKSEEAVRHLLSRGLRALRKALEETNSFHLPDRGLPWEEGRRE